MVEGSWIVVHGSWFMDHGSWPVVYGREQNVLVGWEIVFGECSLIVRGRVHTYKDKMFVGKKKGHAIA